MQITFFCLIKLEREKFHKQYVLNQFRYHLSFKLTWQTSHQNSEYKSLGTSETKYIEIFGQCAEG